MSTLVAIRVAIVGSREIDSAQTLTTIQIIEEEMARIEDEYGAVWQIVSGGATGVDTVAEWMAIRAGIPFRKFEPVTYHWEGTGGFKERNIRIAENCTHLVCITSSASTTYGAGWTAEYAEGIGKIVRRLQV